MPKREDKTPLIQNRSPNNSLFLSYHDDEAKYGSAQSVYTTYSSVLVDAADTVMRKSGQSLFRCARSSDVLLMAVGSVFSLCFAVAIPVMSIAFGGVINALADEIAGVSEVNFNGPCFVYLGTAIVIFVSGYIQLVCWRASAERQALAWRCEYFDSMLRQEIGWFDGQREGALNHQLNEQVESIRAAIGEHLPETVMGIVNFLVAVSISSWANWQVFLTAILIAPFYALLVRYMKGKVEKLVVVEQEQHAMAASIAEETVSNARTVYAFNAENQQIDKYNFALNIARAAGVRRADRLAVAVFVSSVLTYVLLAVILGVGVFQTHLSAVRPGSIFTCFIALLVGVQALVSAIQRSGKVFAAYNTCHSIADIIDSNHRIDSRSTGGLIHKANGKIQFKNVTFAYPSRPEIKVLSNFNLNIAPGSSIAIVGRTGSGKTTLSNLLLRFYDALDGQVLIDSHPIKTLNLHHLRSIIGYVPQQPMLFDMSIAENLKLAKPDATTVDMMDALSRANVWHEIHEMPQGIATRVGELGSQLSGGQKQRIAIARALINNPVILIFDEATSALDSDTENKIQTAIKQASAGRTTITIAHRLSTIRDVDGIIVMDDGRLVESGTHSDLLSRKRGIFRAMYAMQSDQRQEEASRASDSQPSSNEKSSKSSMHSTASIRGKFKKKIRQKSTSDPDKSDRSIAQILRFNRKSTLSYSMSIIFHCISASTLILFMVVVGHMLYSYAKPSGDALVTALGWTGVIIGIGSLNGIFKGAAVALCGRCSERLAMNVRADVFKNVMKQPLSFFESPTHAIGSLSAKLSCGAGDLGKAIENLAEVIAQSLSIVGGLVVGLLMGWQLALILIAMIPFLIVAAFMDSQAQARAHKLRSITLRKTAEVTHNAISNIRTVQALGVEEAFSNEYCSQLGANRGIPMKMLLMSGFSYGLSNSSSGFYAAAGFAYAGYLISIGTQPPVALLIAFLVIMMSAKAFGDVSALIPDIAKAEVTAGGLFHLIEIEGRDKYAGGKTDIKGSITLSKVSFVYPARPDTVVLKQLSLRVEAGQKIALVGSSGCGKSTVLSLLARAYNKTSGTIKIDGTEIESISESHLLDHIGLVDQEAPLFEGTIAYNISFGLTDCSLAQVQQAAEDACIHEFICSLPEGYSTNVGERGVQLSGGQRQRLSIARAIVRQPKIILLDEATSALDVQSEQNVYETLMNSADERTIVIVAHRLSSIRNVDQIFVMTNGRISERGTHNELYSEKGQYYALCHSTEANDSNDQMLSQL